MSGAKRPKVALSIHPVKKRVRFVTEDKDPATVTDNQTKPRPTVPLSVCRVVPPSKMRVDTEAADENSNETDTINIAIESNDQLSKNPVISNRPKVPLSIMPVRFTTKKDDNPATVTDDRTKPLPTVPLTVWAPPPVNGLRVDAEVADQYTNEIINMDIATEPNDELTNADIYNTTTESAVDEVEVKKERVESVVDDLKCSVCDEMYKQPMMLQCLHTSV